MKLLIKYYRIHLRSIAEYKTSFVLTLLGQMLESVSVFLSIYFLFMRFGAVKDYTFNEVLICYATLLMAFSIAETFFRGFDRFSLMVQNGSFDRVMTRPRNEILQILGMKLDLARAGRLFQAIIIIIYAIPTCGIIWSIDKVFTLAFMIIGGVAFFAGLFMVYAGLCFFTIQGLEFMNILTDGGRSFGTYPLSIYGKRYLKFFTFIIPMACFQYYPFLYITGRSDNVLSALTPIFCILFIVPCYLLWRFGVKHYKSTGS